MSRMNSHRKLLVVFDIDETLIQFVGPKYLELWKQQKSRFNPDMYFEDGRSVTIFRPHLREMFELFKNDRFFRPALWTYSERTYANDIARILKRKFDLPDDFFTFVKSNEDIEEDPDELPKNFERVYEEFPDFNKFNSILVDDRFNNINNSSNRYNGIAIKPFSPFGHQKEREIIDDRQFEEELNDTVFIHLMTIINRIKTDIMNCDDDDIEAGFTTEPVFMPKRVARMHLNEYMQKYATKFEDVFSIGVPYLSKKFILIPDYERYPERGGKRNRSKSRKYSRKVRKGTTHRRRKNNSRRHKTKRRK
jgi:hypothetical protein